MTISFDFTWKEPTERQIKALEYVYNALGIKHQELPNGITHHMLVSQRAMGRALAVDAGVYDGFVHKQTEYDLAELMLLSDKSLWYTQAKSWAEKKPDFAPITWQAACKFIVRIIDLGYDEENKTWWNLEKLNLSQSQLQFQYLLLMDLANMLKQIRGKSLNIYSKGFELFISLIVTKKKISEIKKAIRVE